MAASPLSVDERSRRLLRATACLLRSIGPGNGQVEIRLHGMARELEQFAELAATETSAGRTEGTDGGGSAKAVHARPPPLSPGTAAG